jgi:predicted porin
MQKKIIALAVAGLVSGAAYAQVAPNNVTLYGIVDMGYQYSWDNVSDHAKNKSEVKSGGLDGSRVGVKGEEDLGNGLKAFFDATWSFASDVNSAVKLGEGSSVGLEGSFGKVRAGYFGNFLDDNTGVDASGRHGMINTGSLYGTGKYENFVAYYSPVFSGLQVKAGFASNVNAVTDPAQDVDPTAAATTVNVRAYTAAVSYANGPISAGFAYATYRPQETYSITGLGKASDWNAGIKYDFGVAAVSLFGAKVKGSDGVYTNGTSAAHEKKTFWALGVAAPIGANDTIKAGYGQAKLSGGTDDSVKGKAWDIVYLHSLSKRSTVYAMYGNLGGSDDGYLASGTYQQAFNVGLRHTF